MIYADNGKEEKFISFAEYALSILSEENYTVFFDLFDSSRLTEQDLILALKYLDESRPVIKVDNPIKIKNKHQKVEIHRYNDGSGYWMDYDLTTNGEINDLTIQFEFMKQKEGYYVILDDLHTL